MDIFHAQFFRESTSCGGDEQTYQLHGYFWHTQSFQVAEMDQKQ